MKKHLKNQRGFATIAVSVMLLLLITINVFVGSKGSVLSQKTVNNQYRAEEAFQNAEAGVSKIISNINAYLAVNPKSKSLPDELLKDEIVDKYSAAFNVVDNIITSTGQASGGAIRTVTQRAKLVVGESESALPTASALNALGSITLHGSASATDVKSGQSVTLTGSGSVGGGNKTENNANVSQNSNEFKVADAASPTGYRSMTSDEYFMHFFAFLCPTASAAKNPSACKGEAYSEIKVDPKGYVCDSGCGALSDSLLTAEYKNNGKRIFWLNQGMNHKLHLGTVGDPVILLVMNVADGGASVHINGNSEINGILYVDVLTKSCNCSATYDVISVSNKYVFSNPAYSLKGTNPAACTISACQQAEIKCTPSENSVKKKDTTASCNYVGNAINDPSSSVEIDIVGTWDNSGGGKTLITGSAITSGNFKGQGNISFVSSSVVKEEFLPEGTASSFVVDSNGWNDAN